MQDAATQIKHWTKTDTKPMLVQYYFIAQILLFTKPFCILCPGVYA